MISYECKFCRVFWSSLLSKPWVLKNFVDADSGSLVFLKHLEQQVFALVADRLPDGAREADLFLTDVTGSGFPVSPGEWHAGAY